MILLVLLARSTGLALGRRRGTSIISGVGGNGGAGKHKEEGGGERPKQLNAEEIWNSSPVGSFKVKTSGWTHTRCSRGGEPERERTGGDGSGKRRRVGGGESASRREKEKDREREREEEKEKGSSTASTGTQLLGSSGSTAGSAYTLSPPPVSGQTNTYPPPVPSRWASALRRWGRDSVGLDAESDDDTDTERARVSSRTTHSEAFSTTDASSLDQLMLAQDAARHGNGANGVLSRVLRRALAHPAPREAGGAEKAARRAEQLVRRRGAVAAEEELRGAAEETHGMGSGYLCAGAERRTIMVLPLWPCPTDPASEMNATKPPHEIPTEQRQYLLVSYQPTDKRAPPAKKEHERKKGSWDSWPTSSADGSRGRQGMRHPAGGSGVRVPDEGLAVLCLWHEAWLSMPQIATRDHGLVVEHGGPNELQEEPVAGLALIGKAVLEMAWIGCIAVTSFGPAGSSSDS
ncbi:hypothetical protein FB451DRAFT_1438899 [Mycena latifolia]|nr:hypothetical protein FB451DRAFT_1438899 [Mycena latifolia]